LGYFDGKTLAPFRDQNRIEGLALTSDGRFLAVAQRQAVRLWDVCRAKQVWEAVGPIGTGVKMAFVPDGKTLVGCAFQGAVRQWEVATGRELFASRGHLAKVSRLTFSADGKILASGGFDGSVRVWDVATSKAKRVLQGHGGLVEEIALSANGKYLASYSFNRAGQISLDFQVRLWDLATGRLHHRIRQQPKLIGGGVVVYGVAVQYSPDCKTLAVASQMSSTVSLRHPATGKERATLKPEIMEAFAFSPTGKYLAIAEGSVWDVATVTLAFTLPTGGGENLVFSADGKLLAVVHNNAIQLWELATRQRVLQLQRPRSLGEVALAFTPSGRLLATERQPLVKDELDLWDISSGKKLHCFQVADHTFEACALSPDGRLLATAMDDTSVLIWDLGRFGTGAKGGPRDLDTKALQRLWKDLAGKEAPRGYRAIQTLRDAPKQALALMRRNLRPAPPPDASRLARLIRDLDSKRFATRRKATRELEHLDTLAEPALRKALAGQPDLESRRRLQHLLRKLEGPVTLPEALRAIRAVQVLENIGGREARRLLAKLAKGAPDARLTQEAKAALERPARRPVVKP
jgi:WD40 repeat protein